MKKADGLIDSVYGERLKGAKSSRERAGIAQEMISAAPEGAVDAAARYALLERARRVAVDADDGDLAMSTALKLEQEFQFERWQLSTKTAIELAKHVREPGKAGAIARQLQRTVEATLGTDHYDAAKSLCDAIAIAAKASGDASILKLAAEKKKEVTDVEHASTQAAGAMKKLETSPLDVQANSAVGTFRCFYKRDWTQGLPLLSIGGDPTLKKIAGLDLADPKDGSAQVAVADAWRDFAAKRSGIVRRSAYDRAATWYRKATGSLSSLALLDAKKKLIDSLKNGGDPEAGAREQLAGLITGNFTTPKFGPWTVTFDGADFHLTCPGTESGDWVSTADSIWLQWGGRTGQSVMMIKIEAAGKITLSWYGGDKAIYRRGKVPENASLSWSYEMKRDPDTSK